MRQCDTCELTMFSFHKSYSNSASGEDFYFFNCFFSDRLCYFGHKICHAYSAFPGVMSGICGGAVNIGKNIYLGNSVFNRAAEIVVGKSRAAVQYKRSSYGF